jgi:DNA-binding transcriptional LysR family regulator
VELTPHGRELLAVIQRSIEELDAAIASIGRSARRSHQSISLGTTPLVAANVLPPARREFRKQPPGADEFTSFLKSYIATWAGRAGVL